MELIEARRRILLSAPHVEATTPAGVANFTTDLISPLKSLKAGFLPVQSGSGDPSPSNVRAITGWSGVTVYKAGANIWDEDAEAGRIDTETGESTNASNRIRSKGFVPVRPDTTYFYSCNSKDYDGNLCFVFYDRNKNRIGYRDFNSNHEFTTPETAAYLRFFTGSAYGGTYNNDISINYPYTDTSYHSYTGTTIPVTFPAAGKNLLDVSNATHNAYNIGTIPNTLQPNTQYTFSINGTTTARYKLYMSTMTTPLSGGTALHDSYIAAGTSVTFTTPSELTDALILAGNSNGAGNVALADILPQIELGPAPTSYEPYRNAFYGGYVDLVRGEVVATHKLLTITGDEGVTYNSYQGSLYSGSNLFLYDSRSGANIYGICSMVKTGTMVDSTYLKKAYNDRGIQFYAVTSYWGLQEATSEALVTQLKAWNANGTPLQICYELATPIAYPLTPQIIKSLRGTNNIWSDANGDVSVEYWKH